jgi:hypothetical protein
MRDMIIKRQILIKENTKQLKAFGFAPVMDSFNFMDQTWVVWQTNLIFVKIQDTVKGLIGLPRVRNTMNLVLFALT